MLDNVHGRFMITSTAFESGKMMPSRHTSDGENVSPSISWRNVPDKARSLILIMEDHDIPMPWLRLFSWTHWIVYNIPPSMDSLPEAIPVGGEFVEGIKQGITSYRKLGYSGPAPVSGTHEYCFNTYAVDITITLTPNEAKKKNILKLVKGHILAESILIGKYRKQG